MQLSFDVWYDWPKRKLKAVPFHRFQLPLQRKFASSTVSASSLRFRFHIPGINTNTWYSFEH